ncbi:acetylornithine deacetylase [Rhodobacteraceae bacterium N5(2021)]|uniref:Acetylornithine deacetylase n=1 Tax=Gymnodinialimonas phycosphaerae TaxID=2841589 RepID=A0A975YHQ6_9RHOB|nr:acetylornithine deacetylase [Gymnodinialimonas phycosphaerae]MBY4893089.1 acetylornithine deacetylase [Gymnodinialimonas phycosphaerae]
MTQVLSPRDLLSKLVAFPTVSRDSNLELVDWVADYLASHGIESARDMDATGQKASLFAHVGPEVDGGIVLSGHTDVVPVDGQAWDTDPFWVTEKDGKLYGRGTCDMKGFDALAIWGVVEAKRRGVSRPLQLALSRDEEIGCVGAPPMIEAMAGLPRASFAIIGEPTDMGIINGHKGGTGFDLHFRGYEVHSSLAYKGVSAVMESARLIQWANEVNEASAAAADPASPFDPPYSTLHVGVIEGGTAHNITAKDCMFVLSLRALPTESIAEWRDKILAEIARIEAGMKAVRPEAEIRVTPRWDVPGLRAEPDGEAEQMVRKLTGLNSSGVVSFGTEAGQFQAAGYSAVVCGPGSIEQAHQANEFITVDQFQQGEAFIEKLLSEVA